MCPVRLHPHALDALTGYFIIFYLVILQIPHLDKAMALHDDEDLILAVMPVLALRDTRLTDVDAYLPTVWLSYALRV